MSTLNISEDTWSDLLFYLNEKKFIPFLGAGAAAAWLPVSIDIIKKYVNTYDLPFFEERSLQKMTEYAAISMGDHNFPKKEIAERFKHILPPDFGSPQLSSSIYSILAELEIPVYVTTNYDHLIELALMAKGKNPVSQISLWNKDIRGRFAREQYEQYTPDSNNPLVYHLHGDIEMPESMVLTETDYIEFLMNFESEETLSSQVRVSLDKSKLLFLGYSLQDLNIRVILKSRLGRRDDENDMIVMPHSYSDQFQPRDIERQTMILKKYYKESLRMDVSFEDMQTFVEELYVRWNTDSS